MKTRLNLASQPFRNRALPWTVTIVIALASILALLLIVRATVRTNAAAQSVQREVADLEKRNAELNRRGNEIKSGMTPEQLRTLKSAHELVDRKRFSWSRLFGDLEAVLPGGIRVVRITVKDVKAQADRTVADLELIVASKSPTTVTEMISQMDREGIFHAVLVSQNVQRGKGEGGAEYELSVHYIPRAGNPVQASDQNNRPVDTATGNVVPKRRDESGTVNY